MPAALAAAAPELLTAAFVGAGTWVAALAVKHAFGFIKPVARIGAAGKTGASAWGAFSSAAELGAHALAVSAGFLQAGVVAGAAAGIGVACIEIIYVLAVGVIADLRNPDPAKLESWRRGARRSGWVEHMLFIERASAAALHVGARALVGASLAGAGWVFAGIAFVLFAAVDGVATYGAARRWNWFNPVLCRRYYSFVIASGGVTLVLSALAAL